jgi:predicted dehydrogenase
VLFDIATHWADAVIFLAGKTPDKLSLWRSFKNAEAPHGDTHVHLAMEFSG